MPAFDSQSQETLIYPRNTIERAKRSLLCSPFNLNLFAAMVSERVALKEIIGNSGVRNGYTKRPLSELAAENNLVWLIQVGVLRREVDGQGITDSFRLTPVGRQVIKECQSQPCPTPNWSDRLSDAMIRWFRLPF
ncbi:Npun_F0494 family protein [Chlorogloeopsis sp. ULAP02]|uniref:Npun_F0494 family protein n=1 Tax=Chlorogloeopsis sp. ULAP02 TaxID=3107926 RepID=UPI0031370713